MGMIQARQIVHDRRPLAGRSIAVAVVVRGRAPGYVRVGFNAVAGLLRGMRLTLGYFFSPEAVVTQQYPENRDTLRLTDRFRGNLRFKFPNKGAQERHATYVQQLADDTQTHAHVVAEWVRDENEDQWYHNCTGCGKCEAACPNASIRVLTREGEILEDRELDRFIWRLDSCMFCNACVQTCPWDAIEMTPQFENAVYDRRLLVYNLNKLAGPRIDLIQDTEDAELRARMVERRDRFGGPVPMNGVALPNLPAFPHIDVIEEAENPELRDRLVDRRNRTHQRHPAVAPHRTAVDDERDSKTGAA